MVVRVWRKHALRPHRLEARGLERPRLLDQSCRYHRVISAAGRGRCRIMPRGSVKPKKLDSTCGADRFNGATRINLLLFGSLDNLRAEEEKEVARHLDRSLCSDRGVQALNPGDTASAVGGRPVSLILNQDR
jgi:hypothetical protein